MLPLPSKTDPIVKWDSFFKKKLLSNIILSKNDSHFTMASVFDGRRGTFSTGGIVKWNILLYDGLRFCWQAWYFSQTWDRKVELLFPHSHMQLLWSSLYDFFWRWIVVWGRIKH